MSHTDVRFDDFRFASHLKFRKSIIYTSAALIMFLMSVLACVLPAIRAASADPIEALRAM